MLNLRDKILYGILIVGIIVLAVTLIYPNFLATKEVKIYFSGHQAQYLVSESRQLRVNSLPTKLIKELIAGPESEKLGTTIPDGTELLNVKLEDKLATVNFSQELTENHWGGTTGEMMTVYSIVNTLTQLDEIEEVQVLVEGKKIETLAGHLDLRNPLGADKSLINEAKGSE